MNFPNYNFSYDKILFFSLYCRETDLISANDKSKCSSIKKKFFPEAANPAYIPQMNEKSLKNLELLFSTSIFQAPMLKDMSLLAKYGAKIYAFEFAYKVWQYRLWSFQERDTKLERFLAENQRCQKVDKFDFHSQYST